MAKKRKHKKNKRRKEDKREEREEEGKEEGRFRMIRPNLDPTVRRWMAGIILLGLAFLSGLSFFDKAGKLGAYLGDSLKLALGWGRFIFPIILILLTYYVFTKERKGSRLTQYIGIFLLVVSFLGLGHLFLLDGGKEVIREGIGGGYVGYGISYGLRQVAGFWGSFVVLLVLFLISVLIIFESWLVKIKERQVEERGDWLGLGGWWERLKYRLTGGVGDGRTEEEVEGGDGREDDNEKNSKSEILNKFPPTGDHPKGDKIQNDDDEKDNVDRFNLVKRRGIRIDLPIDLLLKAHGRPMSGDVEKNKEIIQKTLANFGIGVEMGEVKVGPTVTQYTLRPSEGVKLSKIVTLQNDLALALAAHPIRIEAPIPGKSLVGIEVPNETTATVVLRELLETKEFRERESNLTFGLGKDVAGHPWLGRLDRLPHLLIAGATGSGKSVCLNSIIVSLLYQNSSEELKFILVDPKRVELVTYNGIPHLLTPVITDVPQVIRALKWTVGEMERRFHVLSEAGRRDIEAYNGRGTDRMPYIIFAIDELADLMTAAGGEVEGLIIRLAQMSRAVGIHLILATQRPSVDIITGLIKANIPARIAFSVASLMDSRTILDMSGAEKLLGRGDMLYLSAEISKPKRLQGAYLSDREIENVIRYLRERSEPEYNREVGEAMESPGGFGRASGVDLGNDDELLEEARRVVVRAGKASASLLQRRLRIGYARAARLLDLLEERGIVGPADGARPREILNVGQELDKVEEVEEVEEVGEVGEDFEEEG